MRFEVGTILHGDSVWVVARATIPLPLDPPRGVFQGDDAFFKPRKASWELGELGRLDSGHFMPDEEGKTWMWQPVPDGCRTSICRGALPGTRQHADECPHRGLCKSLTDGRHLFQYLPLMLPLLER